MISPPSGSVRLQDAQALRRERSDFRELPCTPGSGISGSANPLTDDRRGRHCYQRIHQGTDRRPRAVRAAVTAATISQTEETTRWQPPHRRSRRCSIPSLRPTPKFYRGRGFQRRIGYGTYLAGYLRSQRVDTVIITGVTMAGSTEDAIADGFRPIVVREAVGDRVPGVVEWNLFDIDAKFGDVEPLANVLAYLNGLPALAND